jgi:hypothetical protein
MTRSEQIEAAARALRKVMIDYPGRYTGHPVYASVIAELDYALDARPADAEPVPTVWISDTATYSLHEGGARAMGTWSSDKYRDFTTPLYASPPSPDRTQGAADESAAHVAAQADALAALKELVACKDLKDEVDARPLAQNREELARDTRSFRDYKRRMPLAWTEARRVIAATGEKE